MIVGSTTVRLLMWWTQLNRAFDVFLRSSLFLATFFFFQAEDGIRDVAVTGVQTCALPICTPPALAGALARRRGGAGERAGERRRRARPLRRGIRGQRRPLHRDRRARRR